MVCHITMIFCCKSIKHLNSIQTNSKTKNVWQMVVHCAINDIPIFVENVNFVVKLKAYLMSFGSLWSFGLIRLKNGLNKRNRDSLDGFGNKRKFDCKNCINLLIGIILKILIQIYNWWSKSKSIYTIMCGSNCKIFLSINNAYMEWLLFKVYPKSCGSNLHMVIIHPYIWKWYKWDGISEFIGLSSLFNT